MHNTILTKTNNIDTHLRITTDAHKIYTLIIKRHERMEWNGMEYDTQTTLLGNLMALMDGFGWDGLMEKFEGM